MTEKKVWCTSRCAHRECPKRINHAASWDGPCEYADMKGTEACLMKAPGKNSISGANGRTRCSL